MFLDKRSLVNQVERQRAWGERRGGRKEEELAVRYDMLGSMRPRCCWEHTAAASVCAGAPPAADL